MNRFVFLNLPVLSLETHLGLTASPHAPFPAGYVTLPMYGRSPPLRLAPSHSRWRAAASSLPSTKRDTFQTCSRLGYSFLEPPRTGHTIRQIGHPQAIRFADGKVAIDPIRRPNVQLRRYRRFDLPATNDTAYAHFLHQPCHRAARHLDPFTMELLPDLAGAVNPVVLFPDPLDLGFSRSSRIARGARRSGSRCRAFVS